MKKFINFILWVIVLGWVGICLFDYYNTSQEKDPKFCIKEETKDYTDGSVYICTGAGYKIFKYDRTAIHGYEFGPFWVEERDSYNG